jgi:hypothetical protein
MMAGVTGALWTFDGPVRPRDGLRAPDPAELAGLFMRCDRMPGMRMPIEPERRRLVSATVFLVIVALLLIASDMLLPNDWAWRILKRISL